MESGIYTGWVRHRRLTPVEHSFRNRIYLMYLDLEELETVFQGRWCWSTRRLALARFRRSDHMGDPAQPLAGSIRDFVEQQGHPRPAGPIRLLTHLRYFGFVMNPVSFYYCFNSAGTDWETIVAEVNNTPWGEQHCYVITREQIEANMDRRLTQKVFHVSPFMPLDMQYGWKLTEPERKLTVHIDNYRENEKVFDVTMQLERREITTGNLCRVLLSYPLMTWYVFAAIYWQAFRLWWKRVPFYSHPRHQQSTDPRLTGSEPNARTS
ncbi:DUF1365 domain-containing protein [Gimesia panareensis]|uniref:DUF1365 domain-containing protein n=1 Tax=Gimesia panareensis TaxID=2527978 RepID=UPI0011A3B98F|nr:DUF1365 domain-containing protein [Gimesia panareensis]